MNKKQVFWSSDWNIFQRGFATLKQMGFHPTRESKRNPKNSINIHTAFVPTNEFRRASKHTRTW